MVARLVRVLFPLEPASWHDHASERLWADEVAPGRYRLRNSPFYAKGVSFEDIVSAKPDDGERLVFSGVSLRSGHSTYRAILKFDLKSTEFLIHWKPLQDLGCTSEEGIGNLIAIDVPPSTDVHRVYELLEVGERDGVWNFDEGHCGHAP